MGRIPTGSESPIVERGEVASGEWRVASDNSQAFGRAGVEAC